MKKTLACLAFVFAALFASAVPALAQQEPCQWNYTIPNNISTATYCGNVNMSGIVTGAAVTSIAALENLPSPLQNETVFVSGYYEGNSLGGGNFVWSNSVITPDQCINFPSNNKAGTWQRIVTNPKILNANDCGFIPDIHTSSNSAALDAAFSYQEAHTAVSLPGNTWLVDRPCISMNAGNYYYTGTGYVSTTTSAPCISVPYESVVINITDNSGGATNHIYLYSTPNYNYGATFQGLTLNGGKGLYDQTFIGVNVGPKSFFDHLTLTAFTECGICSDAEDNPFVTLSYSHLYGSHTAIGWNWNGQSDMSYVGHNRFASNGYDVKIGGSAFPGKGLYTDNDFEDFDPGSPEVNFWIAPISDTGAVSLSHGRGIVFDANRFGNEGRGLDDPPVLIAPDDTTGGACTPETCRPLLVWQDGTTDYHLQGLTFSHSYVAGGSPETAPVIRSYVNNVGGITWDATNNFDGGPYTNLIYWEGTRTLNPYTNNFNVSISRANVKGDFSEVFLNGVSNGPLGPTFDYFGTSPGQPDSSYAATSVGDDTKSVMLGSAAGYGDTTVFLATAAAVADARGNGTTAQEITLSSTGGGMVMGFDMTGQTPNTLAYIKFDLAQGTSNTVPDVLVAVSNSDGTQAITPQLYHLNAGWTTYIIPIEIPDVPSGDRGAWGVSIVSNSYVASTATDFRVGNIYVMNSKQLLNTTNLSIAGVNAGKWNGPHILFGPEATGIHMWVDATTHLRILAGAPPTSDTSGTVIGPIP